MQASDTPSAPHSLSVMLSGDLNCCVCKLLSSSARCCMQVLLHPSISQSKNISQNAYQPFNIGGLGVPSTWHPQHGIADH